MVKIQNKILNTIGCEAEFIIFCEGKLYNAEMVIAPFNGGYVGSSSIQLSWHGTGCYPCIRDRVFPTRDDCIEFHAERIREYLKGSLNGDSYDRYASIALKEFNKNYNEYMEPSLFSKTSGD
ncbi:MAG: hypothetical protein HPY53_01570 [Brevinematales bacterium]|nr:hypothetical protein [Brevinematales bacterium]